jgi:hypothetical protein
MDNIYGNTAASGEGGSANILEPGFHKVYVEDIEVVQIQTAKYNGEAADIKLVGVNGGTLSHRVFPFNFQADRTDFNGNLMDQKAQVDDYFGRLNHMLFKAAGEERYTGATNGATNFADLMNRAKSVTTKTNGGADYWQMVIADKNNYSRLPMWKGGCCEAINGDFPCTLKFDESKYGKKQPANAESTEAAGVNQLPFE